MNYKYSKNKFDQSATYLYNSKFAYHKLKCVG